MSNPINKELIESIIDCLVYVEAVTPKRPIANQILKIINEAKQQERQKTLESIDPFDLVESCNPDCSPEEHAYHQGTWDAYLKLEKILSKLKQI